MYLWLLGVERQDRGFTSDMRDYTELATWLSGEPRPTEGNVRKVLRDCFSTIGLLIHHLHPTYRLVRVRRNMRSRYFGSTSELSYRPLKSMGSRQRANTEHTSMFYASSCERCEMHPQIRVFTDENYGLNIALFESLTELRDNCMHGFGRVDPSNPWPLFRVRTPDEIRDIRVTYGVWETTSDLQLVSACPHAMHDEDWVQQNLRGHILNSYVIADLLERLKESDFWKYLACEFSNLGWPASRNCDYAVSAIAAEILCEMGFGGVSYPSTRCDGRGINVAIKPEVADASLRCVKVGLIRLNAEGGELLIEHEKTVELAAGVDTFDLVPTFQ